jgi:hypothetical protein
MEIDGMQATRRGFLIGAGAVLAAPAIVRASSLMPVKAMGLGTPSSLNLNFTPFDEIGTVGGFQAARFRAALLPGLIDIFEGEYDLAEWDRIFTTPSSLSA